MRTRTKVDNATPERVVTLKHTFDLATRVLYDTTFEPLNTTQVTEDVVTPNFHKRKASGEVIFNPYSRTRSVVYKKPGSVSTVNVPPRTYVNQHGNTALTYASWNEGKHYIDWLMTTHALPAVVNIDEQALIDIAVNQAWANIDPSDASALVSIAELNKTINYVKSTMFKVMKIFKAIKRLDTRVLKKEVSFDEIADTYMGLRYGLRPLIIDCEQAVKAFNATRLVGKRATARGKAEDSDDVSVIKNTGTFDGVPLASMGSNTSSQSTTRDLSITVKVRAGVLYELAHVQLPQLKTWGFHDIFGLAWELTPFSFIAGWFMNISDTLAAWQPKAGVNVLGAWYTIERSTVDNRTLKHHWHTPHYFIGKDSNLTYETYDTYGSSVSIFTEEKSRHIGDFRSTPSLDINLDIFKLADMALILRSLAK